MPSEPSRMTFEQLVRWYASLSERTEDDMAAAAARCAQLGRPFEDLRQEALVLRTELEASDMMARTGEVLLGGPRVEVFASAVRALIAARRVFAQGHGDDRKLVMVLTRADTEAADPEQDATLVRRDERLGARDENGRLLEVFRDDQLITVTPITLAMEINRAAAVKKAVQVKRNGRMVVEWMPADFPKGMAQDMMDSAVLSGLPRLRGVAHVPIMSGMGDLTETPGYHEGMKMWIAASTPRVASMVPGTPTQEDAEAALDVLKKLLHTYEFDGPRNEAAAVAGLMTAVLRASMDKAPMLLSTAGQARTGKDHYLRTTSLVSTGGAPNMYGLGGREEEREKRLSQMFHAGVAYVVLNNVNGGLANDDLCTFLSEGSVVARAFGTIGAGKRAEYAGMWAASGNNLEAKGDLVTRCFSVRQVSSSPHPGDRVFDFEPHAFILGSVETGPPQRAALVAAVFTVTRWWLLSGRQSNVGGANDFVMWSRLVREPVLALTGHDVFTQMLEAEEEQRSTEGPGAFSDACGAVFEAAWRLDYPWDQADAARRLERWRQEGGEVVAPPHIQFCESVSVEHAGELSPADIAARLADIAPKEWSGVASILLAATARVKRFLSDTHEDAERGGSAAPAHVAAWIEEIEQAAARVGKAGADAAEAGRMVKKALDVSGGTWRVTVKRDQFGAAMKGGANRTKPVYRWWRP